MSFWGYMTGADEAASAKKRGYNQAQEFNTQGREQADAAWAPMAGAGGMGMDAMSALMTGGGNVAGRLDSGAYIDGLEDPGTFSGVGDLTQDPGYQARMNAASGALNENQFLDGSWGSGPAAKEMASFMQEQGANEYKDSYNRALSTQQMKDSKFNNDRNFKYQTYLTDLDTITGDVNRQQNLASTMLGVGQNVAGSRAHNANMWAQNAGNNAMGVANAKAEGAVNGSWMAGLNGVAQFGSNVATAYKGF